MTDHDAHDVNDHSVLEPVSAPEGRATPHNLRTDAETVGEGAGGFVAAASGLSLGMAAGPVGALLGALAGAVGGWWAGREIAHGLTDDDEAFYRSEYERSPARLADRSYEQTRPAYVAGHLAGRNPDYGDRSFAEVESDLQRGWSGRVAEQCGEWPTVRDHARSAFERARRTTPGR
jgi:hypothetical protein